MSSEPTVAGRTVTPEIARQRTRAVLSEWRGRGHIVVFGAGTHTCKILPVLEEYGDQIAGIADDSPPTWGRRVGRWTVGSPGDVIDEAVTGLLVSSDTQQTPLARRLSAAFGERRTVLTLYPADRDAADVPTLAFTGERQTGGTLEEIELGHRTRYYWALQHLAEGASVLDVACGNGYGTRILADGGMRVLGIDVSVEAIRFARHYYGASRLLFAVGAIDDDASLRRLAGDAGPFDAVVSLETIEHLEHPEVFLATAYDLLKPGGGLYCSTPNAERMALADAPFHRQHFPVEEMLTHLAAAGFGVVGWHGQEGLQILSERCKKDQRYVLYHAVKSTE